VNVGCVPSKHLLAVAEHGAAASDNPFDAVTYTEEPTVDWTEALDGTDEIVERFRQENPSTSPSTSRPTSTKATAN